MKRILIVLLMSFISVLMFCQENKGFEYIYDKAGNRKARIIISLTKTLKSSTIDNPPVEHNIGPLEVRIFPNPTQGNLLVDIQNGDAENEYYLYLYDSSGKLLIEKVQQGDGGKQLNLSSFSSGIYILLLKTPIGKMEYKIIKE